MVKDYFAPLIRSFEMSADPANAKNMKSYLRNQFDFIGMNAGVRRRLMHEFFSAFGYPETAELEEASLFLWELPFREYQHTALDILRKFAKKLRKEDILWIEKLIVQKSWWDTVDGIAAWVTGVYFQKFPEQVKPVTSVWMDSGNMWMQRVSLLFQLNYKEKTDTKLLSDYIVKLSDHQDFFIRKAIGWALRQYSKTNREWVRDFISRNQLSAVSMKEAMKYI